MKNALYILKTVIILLTVTISASAQEVGDYGSAGSANWNVAANWLVCVTPGTWDGAATATAQPTSTVNVWIRSGHTITLEASGKTCKNLTIMPGGAIMSGTTAASNRYLRIYGTTLTNNGLIGNPNDNTDGICFEMYGSFTFTGTGVSKISRIRPGSSQSNLTLTIDADILLTYQGSSGTGGAGIYTSNSNNDNITIIVNAGKTVTTLPKCNINTASSTDSDGGANTNYIINGTIFQDSEANAGFGVAAGKTCNVTINGSWTMGGKISALSTSAGTINITMGPGSFWGVSQQGSSSVDISKATTTVNGTFDLGLASTSTRNLGNATFNSGSKIRIQNGSFPLGNVILNPGSELELYGTSSFNFNTFPASLSKLSVTNTAGVTLGGDAVVTDTLKLVSGVLSMGSSTLTLGQGAAVVRTNGHVAGNFKKHVPAGASTVTFESGDDMNYTPVTVAFNNVTSAGNLSAQSVEGKHPNLGTAGVDTIKILNRYYKLTNDGVAFDNAAATFNFVPSDVTLGANTGDFKVKRYDNSTWTSPVTTNALATSIQATGLTAFGEFAAAELPPLPGLALGAASIDFGNVAIGSSATDSIAVTNTGTGSLTIDSVRTTNALFTVNPAGPVTLTAGQMMKFGVTFSPTSAASENEKLVFFHNAPTLRDSVLLLGTGVALPKKVTSNGTGGGDWALGATWAGGVVPASADTIVIAGTDSVFSSAAVTAAGITLKNGSKVALTASSASITAAAIVMEANTIFYNGSSNPTLIGSDASYSLDSLSTVVHSGGGTVGGGNNVTYGTLILRRGSSGTTAGGNLVIMKDLSLENTSTGATFRGANAAAGDRTHLVKGNVWVYGGTLSGIDVGTAGQTNIWNIMGNVTVLGSNSRIGPFTSAGATGISIFNIDGNLTVDGARLQAGSSSTLGSGTGIFNLNGNFTLTSTSTVATNYAGPIAFNFKGTSPQTVSLGINLQMSTNINDTIFPGASVIFDIDTLKFGSTTGGSFVVNGSLELKGGSKIQGAGSFSLEDNATLKIAHPEGIATDATGCIIVGGTRTFSSNASYIYNGTTAQVFGNAFPAAVKALTIANANGLMLNADLAAANVTLTGGDLDLNGKILTISSSGMLSETAGNTVKGATGKITTTRDIGVPNALNVAGLGAQITSAQNLGITTIERFHSVRTGNGNSSIMRSYNIAPANNTGLNAMLKFYYDESEIGSVFESSLKLFRSPNGLANNWVYVGGISDSINNNVTFTGIDNFAFWTVASDQHPIPVELTSFNAVVKDNVIALNWKTATETQNKGWNIERRTRQENKPASEWTSTGFVNGAGTSSEKNEYSFSDKGLNNGRYEYRLKQIDFDGTFSYSSIVEVELNTIPVEFALNQNFPNPFNPETVIKFALPVNAMVNISVYNAIGEKIADLLNTQMEKGNHQITFSASNLPSGLYFYRMTAGNAVFTKKMVVLK